MRPANPPQTGHVSTDYAQALLDYLMAAGHDPAALFGSELAGLAQPGRRISIGRWQSLLERAIAATGDAELPLRLAAHIGPRHLGLLGFVAQSSRTLGDVLEAMQRYERLVDDINETRVIRAGGHIELHWLPLNGPAAPIFMQLSLASWTLLGRELTGLPDLGLSAHFTFAAPTNLSEYQRLFTGGIFFNQPLTKLVGPDIGWDLPIRHSAPGTHRLLLAQAEADLRALSPPDFAGELREHLQRQLASGRITLADSAAHFGISPRTLQNRLLALGHSYREILEDLRQQLALHYLAQPHLSLADIAFLLGYSEQAAFHHAFQRWQGVAPGKYREGLAG